MQAKKWESFFKKVCSLQGFVLVR